MLAQAKRACRVHPTRFMISSRFHYTPLKLIDRVTVVNANLSVRMWEISVFPRCYIPSSPRRLDVIIVINRATISSQDLSRRYQYLVGVRNDRYKYRTTTSFVISPFLTLSHPVDLCQKLYRYQKSIATRFHTTRKFRPPFRADYLYFNVIYTHLSFKREW